jgi:hypothetical protein
VHLHIANATIHLSMPAPLSALPDTEAPQPGGPPITMPYIGTTPAAGEYWPGQGGRYICTLPPLPGLPARHLIAGEDEAEGLTYGPAVDVDGARSHIDGVANTAALLAHAEEHPAAKWAAAFSADGHSDFHLPSQLDMFMAFICARQLFKKEGWYRTSTQLSPHSAFVQYFEGGCSGWSGKDYRWQVRPFRWIRLGTLNA